MQKKYPFKFLDAYTREDSDIFFGRNEEVEILYEMVFQTDLLLVYGASGTGKTSLIQCGLASKFQSHDWLALDIRRRGNLNESFEKILEEAGGIIQTEEEESLDWLEEDWTTDTPTPVQLSPLAQRLKTIYLKHFKPIYLIFDQFEELYILGDKTEQNQFIETVKEILLVEQPVKIIISIREEYLGYLYEFERKVPELLRKKLRVEPMNLEKVKTVVQKIAALPQTNIRLEKGKEVDIAEQIFTKIRGEEKTLSIQLPYLQVFLDKLYLQITADESRQAEAEFTLAALQNTGNIGDVLRDFLEEQVLSIAEQLGQAPENIWKVLSPFVTLEGTKDPMSEKMLYKRLSHIKPTLIHQTLQAFVKSRILRYTEKEQLYEIAHDALAKQIHAKRSDEEIALLEVRRLIKTQTHLKPAAREFFTQKQLLFITPFLEKLNLEQKEKQWIEESKVHLEQQKTAEEAKKEQELANTKKRLRIVRGLLGLAILAFVVAGYFAWDANHKKGLAVEAQKEATKQKDLAIEAKKEATRQKDLAEKTLEDLKSEQQKTEEQRQEAIRQAENAKQALSAKEREEQAKNKLKFDEILSNAERLFKAGQFLNAKQLYQQALSITPSRDTANVIRAKIKLCNEKIN